MAITSARAFFLLFLSKLTCVWGLTTSYGNSSSTPTPFTASQLPYCGCIVAGDTVAFVWYDQIISYNNGTIVYTVIEGTHSTIDSHLIPSNTTAPYSSINSVAQSIERFADFGFVETITLSGEEGKTSALSHTIEYWDLYVKEFDTWTTVASGGTTTSMCVSDSRAYSGSASTPGGYDYVYTASLDFNTTDSVAGQAELNKDGIAALQSLYASLIGASKCTYIASGGIGNVKMGVSVLTSTSIVYTTQAVTTSSTSTSPPPTSIMSTISASPVNTPSNNLPTLTPSQTPSPSPPPTTSTLAASSNNQGTPQGGGDSKSTTTLDLGTSKATITIVPSSSTTFYLLDGTTLSAGSSGAAVVINGVTVSFTANLASPTQSSPPAGAIVSAILNGIGITVSGTQELVLGTQTLTVSIAPGGQTVVGGQTVSVISGGSSIVIGTQTFPISKLPGGSFVVGTQTLPGTSVVIGTQTLGVASGKIVIGGSTASLLSGGSTVVIGGSTYTYSTVSTRSGGSSLAGAPAGTSVVVGTQTLGVTSGRIVLGGSTVSLVPGGSTVVVGGSTYTYSTVSKTTSSSAALSTEGVPGTSRSSSAPAQFAGGAGERPRGHGWAGFCMSVWALVVTCL